MARETARLELTSLAEPLASAERERVRTDLRRLLAFARKLSRWPALRAKSKATPIVAIYTHGTLAGCALCRSAEPPAVRMRRAFLGAIATADPATLGGASAMVTFATGMRWVEDPASIEVGTEGIAFVHPARQRRAPVLLMPQVARDFGVDAAGFVALLREKAPGAGAGARLCAWTAESVVARVGTEEQDSLRAGRAIAATDADYAAAWLARMIDTNGEVAFAIDPRARVVQRIGELHHARSAIAVQALASHGGYPHQVARARRALGRAISAGLRGEKVEGWPSDRASVAATIALSVWAGVNAQEPLLKLAEAPELGASAWQAAQVALALGPRTPRSLWRACVSDLARNGFAPWTALAAPRVGDAATHDEALSRLASLMRRRSPHRGGASVTGVPECGLTAIAAHALTAARAHRAAADRALDFVRARQLLPHRIPAPLDPTLALGAFSATPVNDVLRADIVGHALSALLAT